jgi:quercetin dioxygenase-like cupin family protein
MESNLYILQSETPIVDLGGGVSRQILGYNEDIMMVNQGAIGAMHTHPHSQTTYCAAGSFDFTIGEETKTIREGDATYIPQGMLHGVVCLEAGVLIDTFNPAREDFL